MSAASSGAVPACVFALIIHANPSLVPQNWQTFLIYQAVVVFSFVFNEFAKKIIQQFYSLGCEFLRNWHPQDRALPPFIAELDRGRDELTCDCLLVLLSLAAFLVFTATILVMQP